MYKHERGTRVSDASSYTRLQDYNKEGEKVFQDPMAPDWSQSKPLPTLRPYVSMKKDVGYYGISYKSKCSQ